MNGRFIYPLEDIFMVDLRLVHDALKICNDTKEIIMYDTFVVVDTIHEDAINLSFEKLVI